MSMTVTLVNVGCRGDRGAPNAEVLFDLLRMSARLLYFSEQLRHDDFFWNRVALIIVVMHSCW